MKRWGVLVLMSLSMFIIVIDTTIMNVSISALVVDLDTSVGGIQAAISLYALVMAAFILIGGKLADILGRKRVFLLGLATFGIGTTIASFSQSLLVLILGWSVLEGIGSALMMPNIQTILRGEYDGARRATAYGAVSAVAAAGAALGPIVGGFLTTYASWRWAFRLEVLIVLVVLAMAGRIRADVRPAVRPKFDLGGALLSILGWSSIVLGILLIQDYGLLRAKAPLVIGALEIAPFGLSVVPFLVGFGALMVLLLLRWQARQVEEGGARLFRPALFGLPGLGSGFAVRFVHMAVMAAFLFLFPLLLQLTFEYSAMETGLALMPYSLAVLVFALAGARLAGRYPAKRIIQVGLALGAAGLLAVTVSIQPDLTPGELASGALFGVGMGLVASQILNLILSSGGQEDTAEIAGLNGTFEQLGNSVGVALLGTIMLVTLSLGIQGAVLASPDIPAAAKPEVVAAVEQSVELLSDSQLQAQLAAAGLDERGQALVLETYAIERVRAFRAGALFLLFLVLVALVLSPGLSGRKLVGGEEEGGKDGSVQAAHPIG